MTRYGMLVNSKECVGCHACRMACQNQNGVPAEMSFITFHDKESGTYPMVGARTVPTQCMQCDNAPCVSVCPTQASYYDGDGVVRIDADRCIGCKYCMAACPYGARSVHEDSGIVDKCRLCVARTSESDHPSNCVNACPAKVRTFGDLDDPSSDVSKAIVELGAVPLDKDLTHAKFYYVR